MVNWVALPPCEYYIDLYIIVHQCVNQNFCCYSKCLICISICQNNCEKKVWNGLWILMHTHGWCNALANFICFDYLVDWTQLVYHSGFLKKTNISLRKSYLTIKRVTIWFILWPFLRSNKFLCWFLLLHTCYYCLVCLCTTTHWIFLHCKHDVSKNKPFSKERKKKKICRRDFLR